MLGVGLDWAEEFHDVALGRVGEGVVEQFRIASFASRAGRSGGAVPEAGTGPG
jgi:hypothetical protein